MTYPGLIFSEALTVRGFALQLYDGFTGQPQLEGDVAVVLAAHKAPLAKTDSATFVFLDLPAGAYSFAVHSSERTPYYLPVVVPVTLPLPNPTWQAFPDTSLADLSKPLDDPGQPAAYKAQRALAVLQPTPQYPFPPDATLVRGTVLANNLPLAGASVQRVGDAAITLSDSNGEFVLFFFDVSGVGQAATIRASRANPAGSVDVGVTLQRGTTVSIQMVVTP